MEKQESNKYSGIFDQIIGLVYRLLFYILVVLIFIGDTIIFLFATVARSIRFTVDSFFDGLAFIGQTVVDVSNALVSSVTNILKKTKSMLHVSYSRPREEKAKKYSNDESQENQEVLHKQPKIQSADKTGIQWKELGVRLRYFLLGMILTFALIGVEQGYVFVASLPSPKLIGSVNYPVSTQIYDRNGNLLYDVFRDQDRTPVVVDELPPYVVQATLAIEDRNFYNHNGISLIGGVFRAIKDTYLTGDLQGGSTITQQLVKSSLLTPERTFERKFKEAILALWTERIYSKQEILELYLNQVPYGGTAYGIEEAAKTFFGKSAKDLNLNEAAFLAGLTRAPSLYSPYLNPQRAVQRRNEVLQSMKEAGYISETEYQREVDVPLQVDPPKTFIRAPHFVFYVISQLQEKYGIRRVEEGGLRIVTTLDLELQDQVEDIVQEELAKVQNLNVNNGAVLVTSPSTGEILAMVGSKNYYEEPYGAFNVTTARRQPGSSIKPLLYSLAIESKQFTPATIIEDAPVVYDIPGSRPYRPVNYDSRFHGNVPLRYAMANSYNIPAVKVLNELGVERFINHAESLGISTWDTPDRYGLSLALGGAEVTMTDMAVAFGTFANYGTRVALNPILRVEDYRGDTLEEFLVDATPDVLSAQTSFIMADMMSDNFARQFAFGTQSDLYIPDQKVAVKTGTTNDKRDNWTNGFTRKYFVGVWVGNNDNTPMNPVLTSGVTGASPIWNRVMTNVLGREIQLTAEVQPPSQFNIPTGIVSKQCYYNRIEYFIVGTDAGACSGSSIGTPSPTEPRAQ